tara:strand:- start:528 stop:1397 length:870 start_codon:yes stop_codon:yes gene_type:complete
MAEPGLLLIRGLGHSGSTLLDLILGAHPSVVGLGEASRVLLSSSADEFASYQLNDWRSVYNKPCTCGSMLDECELWSRFFSNWPNRRKESFEDEFSRLISPLSSQSIDWIVESYQSDERLLDLHRSVRPVRVIHLTRDVRSWIHSEARRGVTRFGRGRSVGWRGLQRWVRVNWKLEKKLRQSSLQSFRLGYEELALAPEASLKLLCDWLKIDFCWDMMQPMDFSSSHIIAGNRMRYLAGRRNRIEYDGAWLSSNGFPLRASLMAPGVASLNQRLVYSNNVLGEVWPLSM